MEFIHIRCLFHHAPQRQVEGSQFINPFISYLQSKTPPFLCLSIHPSFSSSSMWLDAACCDFPNLLPSSDVVILIGLLFAPARRSSISAASWLDFNLP